MKCQARILKEYKKAKADVVWPELYTGPNPAADGKEVCDGEVTVIVAAVDDPYFGGSSASLEVTWTCSRCKYPWVPRKLEIDTAVQNRQLDITDMLED